MGYLNIDTQLLNRTVDIRRKSTTKNQYGGLTESSNVVYNSVRANIQEKENRQLTTETGETVIRTHTAFLEADKSGSEMVLLEGDKLFDRLSNLTYRIIGVKRAFNRDGQVHHNQLDLEVLREDPVRNQGHTISAKASIT